MSDVSQLLEAASAGDRNAADRAFALVYAELKRVAQRQARAAPDGHGATSLVHEAYLRLVRPDAMPINDRVHFFALAARVMRQLVVDHARERNSLKRGGGKEPVALDALAERVDSAPGADQVLDIDRALGQLAACDPALERLVEMRFFAGLTLEEIAPLVGRNERSLKRDWRRARAVLYAALEGDSAAQVLPDE